MPETKAEELDTNVASNHYVCSGPIGCGEQFKRGANLKILSSRSLTKSHFNLIMATYQGEELTNYLADNNLRYAENTKYGDKIYEDYPQWIAMCFDCSKALPKLPYQG